MHKKERQIETNAYLIANLFIPNDGKRSDQI